MPIKKSNGVTQEEKQVIYDLFDGTEDYYQWPIEVRPEVESPVKDEVTSNIYLSLALLLMCIAVYVETS